MKKVLLILLTFVLMFSIVGCGNNEKNEISIDEATEIALTDSGVSSTITLDVERDEEDNQNIYVVTFKTELYFYKYEILCKDGTILYKGYNDLNTGTAKYEMDENSSYIGKDKAKEIALKEFNINGTIKDYECELEKDDGRYVYDISFDYEKMEYDIEIDAFSGEVVKKESEKDN